MTPTTNRLPWLRTALLAACSLGLITAFELAHYSGGTMKILGWCAVVCAFLTVASLATHAK